MRSHSTCRSKASSQTEVKVYLCFELEQLLGYVSFSTTSLSTKVWPPPSSLARNVVSQPGSPHCLLHWSWHGDIIQSNTNHTVNFCSVLSASWPATPHSHQDYHHINHIVMDTWRQWRELHPRWERHSGTPTHAGTTNEFEAVYSTVLWQVNWMHIHTQICSNYIHYPLNKKDHLPSAPHENQCHLLLYSGLFAIISHYLVFRQNTQVLTGRLKSRRKD